MSAERHIEDALRVALEGGVWPRDPLIDLIAEAIGCSRKTVRNVASTMPDVKSVSQTYWFSGVPRPSGWYLQGHSRVQLIRHLVCRQEPSAAASDCREEGRLDDLRDLMGAEEQYEDESRAPRR